MIGNGNGIFITFEGIDGVGKTTQAELLTARLRAEGFEVLSTSEPTWIFKEKFDDEMIHGDAATARTLLYFADRAQHTETEIKPALLEGKIVICDRWNDSGIAYGAVEEGFEVPDCRRYLKNVAILAANGLQPDLTFLLLCDPKIVVERKNDLTEEDIGKLQLIQGYFELCQFDAPNRVLPIRTEDASAQEIGQLIWDTMTGIMDDAHKDEYYRSSVLARRGEQ